MNTKKLRSMIIYIVSRVPGIGKVQLQKAMLIADRFRWAYGLRSISGCEYIKKPLGPVIEYDGYIFLNKMIYDDEIIQLEEELSPSFIKLGHHTTQAADLSVFDEMDLDCLDRAVEIVEKTTASRLSQITHDSTWVRTAQDEIIPYETSTEWIEAEAPPLSADEIDEIGQYFQAEVQHAALTT